MLTGVDNNDDSNATAAGRSLLDEIVLGRRPSDARRRTAAGAVTVKAPRVNDKRVDPDAGERQKFSSAILPARVRKSPQMNEVLPLLYPQGLSTSEFGPALEQFLGSGAGLSAASITRLTAQWQDEAKAFQDRDLSGTDFVYLWVDGIHLEVRLEREKLCLLVMIGVRADGRKDLVALTDGYHDAEQQLVVWTAESGSPTHDALRFLASWAASQDHDPARARGCGQDGCFPPA